MSTLEERLTGRGFIVHHFATGEEAARFVLESIPSGRSVGIGGSMTVRTLRLDERLAAKGCPVYWHWTAQNKAEALRRAQQADVYLASANAIDEGGILYNIDGTGNRVSALLFGPGEVFVIAGANKLVKGGEKEAIERIKTQACGQNARRLGLNTPCAKLNHCVGEDGCASPQRMCNVLQKIERAPGGRPFHVVLVDEELGY
jgi:hypothetical protein